MGQSKTRPPIKAAAHEKLRAQRIVKKAEKKAKFLRHLGETGGVHASCRLTPCGEGWAYEERAIDPEFAKGWETALEHSVQLLEQEARRRALKGVKEAVYHKGEVVGHVQRYSDVLTIFLLKAHRPGTYRERVDVNHGGTVKVDPMKIYLPSNSREVVLQGRALPQPEETEAQDDG